MFLEQYKAMHDDIAPDEALVFKTINGINGNRKQPVQRQRHLWRRPAVIAAAALLCILTAMPVMAINVPVFYELLYTVSPETAQFFMPVRRSCEDNGIRMEVIATYIHDNTADIYITMQDLNGDRVDATTDLLDSYDIHRPFDSAAHCERVGYDPETKTATFLITITEWENHRIEGDKMTFSVRCFASRKQVYENVPVDIDLTAVEGNAAVKDVYMLGGGGLSFELFMGDHGDYAAVLDEMDFRYPVAEGMDIVGIGYVGDLLHIQLRLENALKTNSHGYFYLKDEAENERFYDFSVGFAENMNEPARVDYDEFVFDIPRSEIANYSLYGSFYTSGLYTEGNWRVTFPLEASWSRSPSGRSLTITSNSSIIS